MHFISHVNIACNQEENSNKIPIFSALEEKKKKIQFQILLKKLEVEKKEKLLSSTITSKEKDENVCILSWLS